jgi:hypothetical protein
MRRILFYSLAAGLLCLAAGLLSSGCSKTDPSVRGKVTLNDQPLQQGSIRFVPVPPTTGPGGGAKIDKGTYRIEKGLTVGKYKVEILGIRLNLGKKVRHPLDQSLIYAVEESVPQEYNLNSTLVQEVRPGLNKNVDFALQEARKGK